MKSTQLLTISSITTVPRIRLSKSVAALFAVALTMGLGADSALAQGGYYPQVNPLGGAPFIPNGFPVTSNPSLALIESKMTGNATLVIPALAPKHVASLAEYKAAVQAAAIDVAGAGGGSALAALAAEVAKYRQAPPSQVGDGLGAIAAGIIASPTGTKSADLKALAFNAAKVNPVGVSSGGLLGLVFTAAAADNTLVSSVGDIAKSALQGAVAGSPPSGELSPSGVRTLLTNAVSAIGSAPAGNASTMTPALKGGLITALANTVVPVISGNPVTLNEATSVLTALGVQPYVPTNAMVLTIKGLVVANDVNYGAIAQGGLRGNPAASAAIKAALATAYTNDLVDAFNGFASPASAAALSLTYDPAAVAAAGATKFSANAPAIVKDVLNTSGASSTQAQDIIGRGIAAAIGTAPQNIASAAVGAGGATLGDVVTAATLAAPIGSAGAIARAVAVAGTLTPATAFSVGTTAIAAAAAASPVTNKTDAYSDIAFNLAATGGPAAFQTQAVSAEAQAIVTANGGVQPTAPTYVAIVSAAAGSPANRAAILSAGNLAAPGADTAASTAGVNLLATFTNVPLANYQATLAAVASVGNDARNLAVLYAASLGNPGDATGGLAALIAKTSTSSAALTAAAISATRSKQNNLAIVSDIAVFMKANPTADIQAYVGHQILDNPIYLNDISTAATVVRPEFSHNIAHTVAFNQPKAAYGAVSTIFLHSKITFTTGVAGVDKLTLGDRPAAAAAITAALTTGVLENTITSQFTAADRKSALQSTIVQAVIALVNPSYNDTSAGSGNFRQSNGVTAASFTSVSAKGVAGGITGFVAQMVNPGINDIDADTLNALTQATYNAGLLTGTTYMLDIAQAAAQAFGWVTGTATAAAGSVVAGKIAAAVYNGYPVAPATLAMIRNAVDFGINEAAGGAGNPGAGAGGLRDLAANPLAPYYDHHSAQGRPVSNIFSL